MSKRTFKKGSIVLSREKYRKMRAELRAYREAFGKLLLYQLASARSSF